MTKVNSNEEDWQSIGYGKYFEYQPNVPGIFHLKAVVVEKGSSEYQPGKEYTLKDKSSSVHVLEYVRQYDLNKSLNENRVASALKKGFAGCFGVVEKRIDKLFVEKAASRLGDSSFARQSTMKESDLNHLKRGAPFSKDIKRTVTDLPRSGSFKCNIFVFIISDYIYEVNLAMNQDSSYRIDVKHLYDKDTGYDEYVIPLVYMIRNRNITINNWKFVTKEIKTKPEPGWLVMNNKHIGILDYDGTWINASSSYGIARNFHLFEDREKIVGFRKPR